MSKVHTYKLYYDVIKKKYEDEACFVHGDTDSVMYALKQDFNDDF